MKKIFIISIIFIFISLIGFGCGKQSRLQPGDPNDPIEDNLTPATVYTAEELGAHNTPEDCWVAIDGTVYDVSDFVGGHQGGAEAITRWCGQDASPGFNSKNNSGSGHSATSKLKLDPYFKGNFKK